MAFTLKVGGTTKQIPKGIFLMVVIPFLAALFTLLYLAVVGTWIMGDRYLGSGMLAVFIWLALFTRFKVEGKSYGVLPDNKFITHFGRAVTVVAILHNFI